MPSLNVVTVAASELTDPGGVALDHVDVAVVHGAPSLLRWRSRCAALARSANLVVVAGGRTGGTLLLSSLGVDVEATREIRLGGRPAPVPPGGVVAVMRRLGSPFVVAAGRSGGQPAALRDRLTEAARSVVAGSRPTILYLDGELSLSGGVAAAGTPSGSGSRHPLELPEA